MPRTRDGRQRRHLERRVRARATCRRPPPRRPPGDRAAPRPRGRRSGSSSATCRVACRSRRARAGRASRPGCRGAARSCASGSCMRLGSSSPGSSTMVAPPLSVTLVCESLPGVDEGRHDEAQSSPLRLSSPIPVGVESTAPGAPGTRRRAGELSHVKVGVPKELKPGERRVALVPEAVKKLARQGLRGRRRARRRGARRTSPTPTTRRRARRSARATDAWAADAVLKVAAPEPSETPRSGRSADRLPVAAHERRSGEAPRRGARDELRDGGDPAHDPGAGDGRAVLAGRRGRLPGGARGRAGARQVLPDADHRRRHGEARRGCWCSAPASPGCRRSRPPSGSARWSRPTTCAPR